MPGGSTYTSTASSGGASAGQATAIGKAVEAETGDNLYFGKSSVDGRLIILRSVADDNSLTLYEMDGTTLITDGSTFIPGLAASQDRAAVPVKKVYAPDPAIQIITLANILALTTIASGEKAELTELYITPDENNTLDLSIDFLTGSASGIWAIKPGTLNTRFSTENIQPARISNFNLTIPINNGATIIATVLKVKQ
jgi:hypothetical protein